MSGLDKINSHILEEANQTAAAKLAEAREKAERIVAEAGEKAQAEAERSRQISERDIKNYMDRVASSCDMQKKPGDSGSKAGDDLRGSGSGLCQSDRPSG